MAGLRAAIDAVQADIGGGLLLGGRTVPLKQVEVTRLSPTTALATATFNYILINAPSAPGDSEFTDIRYEVTEMRVPVYRSTVDADGTEVGFDADGLPAGDVIGCEDVSKTLEGGGSVTVWVGRPVATMFAKTAV